MNEHFFFLARRVVRSVASVAVTVTGLTLAACGGSDSDSPAPAIDASTPTALDGGDDADSIVATNLALFDQLDFVAYSTQDYALFEHLHCPNVVVTYGNGQQTTGIAAHEAAVKSLFVWAPDQTILEHPTRVGQGDDTAVVGRWRGTFSNPMPLPDGGAVPPTGKSFDVHLATFAHWTNGCIDNEQLFSDTGTLLGQIGL